MTFENEISNPVFTSDSAKENSEDLSRSLAVEMQKSFLIAHNRPAEKGDLPPLPPSPHNEYRIGHRTPPDGLKMVITGPVTGIPTAIVNVNAYAAQLGGFAYREVGNLHDLISSVIAESREFGPVADVVIRSHGEPGKFKLGSNVYDLSDPEVIEEFGRPTKAHALRIGAQIEFQGCNIAVGADDAIFGTLKGLKAIANVTQAHVLGSPNLQDAKFFGWKGQVIDVPPQSN